jgi:hypothetical protein
MTAHACLGADSSRAADRGVWSAGMSASGSGESEGNHPQPGGNLPTALRLAGCLLD